MGNLMTRLRSGASGLIQRARTAISSRFGGGRSAASAADGRSTGS